MKAIIACGGTSGHINPAISIADEIKRREPDSEILFIGTENKLEADLVPRAGYPIEFIEIRGLSRAKTLKGISDNIKTLDKFMRARRKVKKIIREFCPDVIIGTGGYVSAPVLSEAEKLKCKTVIHEQNAFAGVTTKMLSKKADRVLLSFPLVKPLSCAPEKCAVVGNPVNPAFIGKTREESRKKLGLPTDAKVIVSCGGSLGATKINDAFYEMALISDKKTDYIHIHGASRDYETLSEKLKGKVSDRIRVLKYIYDMPDVMAAADVVISRSGAMTLTEISALGRASILIPSPNVTENHQYFNAKTYSDAGAAVLIEEKDLTGEYLFEELEKLIRNPYEMQSMEIAAKGLANPDSLSRIYDEIKKIL